MKRDETKEQMEQTTNEQFCDHDHDCNLQDETEILRRNRMAEISGEPKSREALEAKYGTVWSSEEMRRDFTAIGFMAPYVVVIRKCDGVKGSLEFCHCPRFYFSFVADK